MKSLSTTSLSILDLAKYSQGQSIGEAYKNLVALAQKGEEWGFKRYWLAEHHSLEGVASAATSILISHVADHTKKIRVGSGGIMLPNHPTLVIAEQFGTLGTLYPGRIDLGLGRAPGSDQLVARMMRRDQRDFGEMLEELRFFFEPAEPGQKIKAIPGAGVDVPIWILGSSLYSAHLAARTGLPYAFAGHFAPAAMMEAFDIYRREFQPSSVLQKPHTMVGVPVVAAETDDRAEYLATSIYQLFLNLIRNDLRSTRPPVKTMEGLWAPHEEAAVKNMTRMLIVGGPLKVKAGLERLIAETQVDELIITSDVFAHEDRLRSFDLIAQVAGLANREATPTQDASL